MKLTQNPTDRPLKILVSGGGTGGHIYPALALIERIQMLVPNAEFLYIGTERGLESKVVREKDVPFRVVNIEGFKRKLNLDGIKYNFKSVSLFLKGVNKSKKIIKEFEPDVAIGTGGYVCAPVLYAASRLHIPTIIHEQNSVAGITNKFLARFVDKIAICFEEVRKDFAKYSDKIIFTGNPRAQEVAGVTPSNKIQEIGLDPNKKTAIMFGGSRGAKRINETFVEIYQDLLEKDYQLIFVTGNAHYEEIKSMIEMRYGEIEAGANVLIQPYVFDMPRVFAEVELVVARSGATTIAELTALGLPAILIPSPNVTEDHQTKNAMSLVNKGAASIIKETDLTGDSLLTYLDELMDNNEARTKMAQKSKAIGKPTASDDIIKVMVELIKENQ